MVEGLQSHETDLYHFGDRVASSTTGLAAMV
jgi:hypothetical protein